ncbi:MAG: hypothetical protein Cons2KO_34120 [Congregibacter sp.]
MKASYALVFSLFVWLGAAHGASADVESDQADIEGLLRAFLAGTEQKSVHADFWADDLIYTSSAGERRGKSDILAGFDNRSNTERMSQHYGAEDLTIRVMDDIAVITFRLTADRGDMRVGEYFNTGVFRRDGKRWRAFTWQATRIP